MFKSEIIDTWKADGTPYSKVEQIRAKQKVSGYTLNDIMEETSGHVKMSIYRYAIINVENDKVDEGNYRCMVVEASMNDEAVTFSTSSNPFISALVDMCADLTGESIESVIIEVESIRSKNFTGNFYKPSIVDIV